MKEIETLDEWIIGRVEPHIYAFSTDRIPGYLKVGDTCRPVKTRLKEWRVHFPDLKQEFEAKAVVSQDVFFRDYSVHEYLTGSLGKRRLLPDDMKRYPRAKKYSREFFKDTDRLDVQEAIDDIADSFSKDGRTYQFYHACTQLPREDVYPSAGFWTLRPNQKQAVEAFKRAVASQRTNLLMYAVMRFGKSFTALCCAKEIGARMVLVVSAKADVAEEWKKTVQSADNFNRDYVFLSSEQMYRDSAVIREVRKNKKGAVIFLTLQDLQGTDLKEKHKELFASEIDLMIVDETHYGARAERYGAVIRTAGYEKDICLKFSEDDGDDFVEAKAAKEQLKALSVKIKLHLSGTPYRILMSSEFAQEDVISFCQFSDIVREQQEWDAQNTELGDEKQPEWENPYFGFPQMIRFAFTPNQSALALLERLKRNGVSYALSKLFQPVSITKKADGSHKKFIHEREVFELFAAIDGSREEEGIFSFLNDDRIKDGKMCRHIVCVLPYCASCDALEALLLSHADSFLHLGEYRILNISGVDAPKRYRTVKKIKEEIKSAEEEDQKTITLTVNRMLTGSTVEQWDTMIFLKDTASPQEYDQAVFRLQNQYVTSYMDADGNEIKYNRKPQTLLVDFDPHRMFRMQEQKSLIYTVNTDSFGNRSLKQRMEEEIAVSPIITVNRGKLKEVEAADILTAVSEYSDSRGVKEEAEDLPVDAALFEIAAIREEIKKQAQLGTKGGLRLEAYQGEETEFDEPAGNKDQTKGDPKAPVGEAGESAPEEESHILQNKFKTYYARILFFAFLTESKMTSLEDLFRCFDTEENRRILKHLDLNIDVLSLIWHHINPFVLNALDYKIQNINRLAQDTSVSPLQRAVTAMGNFGKLSESEVTTPLPVAEAVIRMLSDDCFLSLRDDSCRILDLASKMGEFAIAVCKRCEKMGIDRSGAAASVAAVTTSPVAYEFTRKVYRVLGLSTDSIAAAFYSRDLPEFVNQREDGAQKLTKILTQAKPMCEIKFTDEAAEEEEKAVKFNAVVGNPPYQEESQAESTRNGQKPRRNIFHYFQKQAMLLSEETALIFPGERWLHQSGKGLKSFGKSLINDVRLKKVVFYPDSRELFPATDIPDGISIVVTERTKTASGFEYEYITEEEDIILQRSNPGDELLILNPHDISIVEKAKAFTENYRLPFLHESILPRSLFGIESDFIEKHSDQVRLYTEETGIDYDTEVKLLANDQAGPAGRSRWFVVGREHIRQNREYLAQWQVVVSSAHPGGQDGRDNQIAVADNHSAFGRSRVALKSFDTKEEAEHFRDYAESSLIRYLFLMTDESLSSLAKLVPDVKDYSENNSFLDFTKPVDLQLYRLMQLEDAQIRYIESKVSKKDRESR